MTTPGINAERDAGGRDGDYEPHPVQASGPSSLSGTPTERIDTIFEHAAREHAKHLDAVERDKDRYSSEGLARQLSSFADTNAAKAVDAAEKAALARVEVAEAELAKQTNALVVKGDTAADEIRNMRTWERTQRTLDSTPGAAVIGEARRLLTTADRESLGVILAELPSYLTAKGVPTDWMPAAIAEAAPEVAVAQQKLTRATQVSQIAASNARSLRASFKTGRGVRSLVKATAYDPDAVQ